MKFEYKVVPFRGAVHEGDGADIVGQQLQNAISAQANAGWEFVQLGDVNIEIKPGCIGRLLSRDSEYARYDQLIFRREAGVTSPPSSTR